VGGAAACVAPVRGRPVGGVGAGLRFAFFTPLRARLGERPIRASELFAPLRLAKTEDEIERIRRAGALVTRGIDVACELARPGMTELELQRAIERALYDDGAESADYVLVQAGPNSALAHHSADA